MQMDTQERNYAEIEREWDELAAESIRRHVEAGGRWQALLNMAPPHRDVVIIDKLTMEMYNGGFIQFFCNWGHGVYLLALDVLDAVGAQRAKSILERAYGVIARLEDCDDIGELWDIPRFLTAADMEVLDALDSAYWEDEDFIFRLAIDYFRSLL